MKECTTSATLDELLKRPTGLLALHGRDGEQDDDKGAKPEDDANAEESKDGAKPDGDKGEGGNKPKGDTETVETLTRKLANSEEARNRAVDKKNELVDEVKELKTKISKLEADGSPDETIKAENEKLVKDNATLAATNERLMLEIALRDDNAHDWVSPDDVLRLADLSEVDFDAKTNKPRGLKAALDKLAKDKPFLLKPKAEGDEGDAKPGASGRPPAPRGKTTDAQKAALEAKLKAKYPALRR
jgi:hypothetical protein